MGMRQISKLEMVAMLMPIMAGFAPEIKIDPRPKSKSCLLCKSAHSHNNEFCSAECCRSYRSQKTNK